MYTKTNYKNESHMGGDIAPPKGKLGVLLPGLSGAVSTTFISGVEAVKKGIAKPIGSLTQLSTIKTGKKNENEPTPIKDFVPLANLDDLVFGGWDIFEDNCFEAALKAGVIETSLLDKIKPELEALTPMSAVFSKDYIKNIEGPNVKTGNTKMDLAEQLIDDIDRFKKENSLDRLVCVWCASTEVFLRSGDVHSSIEKFEKGLKENHPEIAPSMIYTYAAIQSGVPYANGSPNLSADIPALLELSEKQGVPIAGKDFKTGQTLMKTIIAPGLKSRMIGLNGWFSTNILGNRDGKVLDDPYSFKTKEESKMSVLDSILQPDQYPELYGNYYHKVRINYYPPRGDDKEAWDNIDIFGWLGYPMQIKINFLCKDSILAAPVVLDLALFMDLAQRLDMSGVQDWLSFYFKSPTTSNSHPIHDVFRQMFRLKGTLLKMKGLNPVSELGLEYDDLYDIG